MRGLILDPAPFEAAVVTGGDGVVEAGVKESGGARYLVVVSGAREPRQVRIAVPGPAAEAQVLFARPRRLPVRDGAIEDALAAYGTLVLKLEPPR
jgi:hypothetical protein